MRLTAGAVIATVSMSLVGCNQPAVTPKLPAFQSSENTVRDWNDVADRIASQLGMVGLIPAAGTTAAPSGRPIYIKLQAPDSAFVRSIAERLEADIMQAGGTISRRASDATVVNLDVNFIAWGPRDKPPGLLGTTAGILAIPPIVIGDSSPMSTWSAANAYAFAAVGIGMLTDLVIAVTPTMNAEAIVSATVVSNDQVIMKYSAPLYVRANDLPLYAKSVSLAATDSWTSRPPLTPRPLRYAP